MGAFPQSNHKRRVFALKHHSYRVVILAWELRLISVLEVKILREIGEHDLEVALCECFAKADALTSTEGHPAHWVPFPALRCQVKWALRVKPLWEEFVRSVPLSRILVEGPVENAYSIALLDGQLLGQCHVLWELDATYASWALESKALLSDHVKIIKVKAIIDSDCLLQSLSQTFFFLFVALSFKNLSEFSSYLGQAFWALG